MSIITYLIFFFCTVVILLSSKALKSVIAFIATIRYCVCMSSIN